MDKQRKLQLLREAVAALTTRIAELEALRDGHRLLMEAGAVTSGDTAWMLSAASLVLLMTLPGLTLYYAGMVRVRNVLTTIMQVFSIACVVTILWMICGYSLAFGPAHTGNGENNEVFGDGSRIWLRGMTTETTHDLAPHIPEPLFCAYELTFAIITPALICGSVVDRMNYLPMLIFTCFWHLIVYCAICHIVWHPNGFLYKAGNLDYAGGGVVHLSSGISGMVFAFVLGTREGFGMDRYEPHNILFSFIGSCMLWVGWFGFNAGSAFAANENAAMAQLCSQLAAAASALSWLTVEWRLRGKPSVLGLISGAFAGLVCVTPASGYVNPTGAFFIGLYGGPLCYFGCQLKHYAGFDDALDVFGIHAVGGIVGAISTAFFSTERIGGEDGIYYTSKSDGWHQLSIQLYGIAVIAGWTAFATYVICKGIDLTIGLRVSADVEFAGLDQYLHGETIEQKKTKRKIPNFKYSDLIVEPRTPKIPAEIQNEPEVGYSSVGQQAVAADDNNNP